MKCVNKSMHVSLFHYVHHYSQTETFPICSNWKTPRISVWELFNKISEHIQRKGKNSVKMAVFLPVLNENTESPTGRSGSSKFSSFIQHNFYLCHWLAKNLPNHQIGNLSWKCASSHPALHPGLSSQLVLHTLASSGMRNIESCSLILGSHQPPCAPKATQNIDISALFAAELEEGKLKAQNAFST